MLSSHSHIDNLTKKMLPTSNIPDPLSEICLEFLANNIELLRGAALHQELTDDFLRFYLKAGRAIDDTFAEIFSDPTRTKIHKVTLRRGSLLTESGIDCLLKHKLTSLDVTACRKLPNSLLSKINKNGNYLEELSVSFWGQFKLCPLPPTLKKLEIYNWRLINNFDLETVLKPLSQLVFLNLSKAKGLQDLSCLDGLCNLKVLILFQVPLNEDQYSSFVRNISKLKCLTHLDISATNEGYLYPDAILAKLVDSLPNLEYLDISETNLPGRGVAQGAPVAHCDILGLKSRVSNPLKFLGLLETKYEACRRFHIPAVYIAGDANEEQLMVAARAYMGRPHFLEKVLNEIYNLCREADEREPKILLEVILEAMERHERRKSIQISGSATLFFIVKGWDRTPFPTQVKRRIIRVLLNGMFNHREDQFMLRNGCLCLCQFKIPQDVMFEYKRLVDILLFTATEIVDALFIQRIAIYLLNSLACQVDGTHKHILGDAGAVQRMLKLIEDRLKLNVCDDVMEVAWSTLWNVTDETAENCRHFLDGDGMEYFIACLEAFPDKEELLRNMMGLLGNVAEVASLRPRLMTEPFMTVFTQLLLSESDGIEVSYNAAGVLAHMCSDGLEAWTICTPARENVLAVMTTAIEGWDLGAERNINYRSFEPILGLLKVHHTPQCQHWAVWALANLTRVYPSKYCKLVEAEGGLELLEALLTSSSTKISTLANMVLNHCRRFREKDYQGVQLDG